MTVHERVRLVLLPTTVTDRRGRPVRGLTAESFRVFENDVRRPIESFGTEEELPIALAFLMDVSGSMELRGRMDDAKRVARTFVDGLRPEDLAGLICFADEQVTWVTRLTGDRERFLERLDVQYGQGPTALYDALAASPALLDEEIQGRRAVVLLTDGLDNASRLTTLEAVWIARRVSVPIYGLNFVRRDPSRLPKQDRQNLRILNRFSEETGGASFAVHEDRDLKRAVAAIQAELRFQYVIGYYPAEETEDRGFRRVRVETEDPRLSVRTRSGYYADP